MTDYTNETREEFEVAFTESIRKVNKRLRDRGSASYEVDVKDFVRHSSGAFVHKDLGNAKPGLMFMPEIK
jgi:hypothetical protein